MEKLKLDYAEDRRFLGLFDGPIRDRPDTEAVSSRTQLLRKKSDFVLNQLKSLGVLKCRPSADDLDQIVMQIEFMTLRSLVANMEAGVRDSEILSC